MGMYTGIRVNGKLKQEWVERLREMKNYYEEIDTTRDVNLNRLHTESNFWNLSDNSVLKKFGDDVSRASFIPYGVLSYMPDEWESDESKKEFNNLILDDGTWNFQCSLKNYESEIEQWMEEIVPVIFDSVEIEYFYEEWVYSKLFKIIDKKVIEFNDKYKLYGYEDDNDNRWY